VLYPETEADWRAIRDVYPAIGGALDQVFAVARESGCKTVVVEHRYIDFDFRSEHAAFWSLHFQVPPPFTRRLHFFSARIPEDSLHKLPDEPGYLGYSILRPVALGRVGRTVLAPPPRVADATLTTITDTVSFFGNDLSVRGVPFCEQDREYLRCAHAAAWVCHYIAVRNHMVGHRSTANLVGLTPAVLSEERALPSKGMQLNQLQAVFGATGQPALLYGFSALPDVDGVRPADPGPGPDGRELPRGCWDVRCISIICRYLNSGFPVLVAGDGHAWVMVGWKRAANGYVTFVACDDQVGPYEEIPSPFEHYRAPWHSIMVPLPPKVFLTAEAAENNAHLRLHGIWSANPSSKPLAEALVAEKIQLRTRLTNVRTFKRRIAEQTTSDDVLRAVRLSRMPNFVWVVEAHDRARCGEGDCVVGTVLYDSTSSDHDPRYCAIAVPGAVAIFHPDGELPTIVPAGHDSWKSTLPVH